MIFDFICGISILKTNYYLFKKKIYILNTWVKVVIYNKKAESQSLKMFF